MDHYVVDFFCLEAKLIVEVDGGQHDWERAKDEVRTQYIEGLGFRVIRFWNNDVFGNLDGVLEQILIELKR
jgi:very-short-patch-repair endonuclease